VYESRLSQASPRGPFDIHQHCRRICAAVDTRVNIAAGSATEARYLADVARRLGYFAETEGQELVKRYTELSAQLQALIASLNSTI
jgi:four helix bundle protein